MLTRKLYAARLGSRATRCFHRPLHYPDCPAGIATAAAYRYLATVSLGMPAWSVAHGATAAASSSFFSTQRTRSCISACSPVPCTTPSASGARRWSQRALTSHAAASSVDESGSPGAQSHPDTHRSSQTNPTADSSSSSSSSVDSSVASSSAVHVESFTLDAAVVRRDVAALERWNEIAAALDDARARGSRDDILSQVELGLGLLAQPEKPAAVPIQCECLLCMEAAQAEYNACNYDAAMGYAGRALRSLGSPPPPPSSSPSPCGHGYDAAQAAEVRQLMGYILCRQGRFTEAQTVLESVLHWIDVDAKSAMPMQAVAALGLRRTVLTGLAQSWIGEAAAQAPRRQPDAVAAARALYGRALDVFIEALDGHVDEKDGPMVKMTLEGIRACFEGVGDMAQAETTCEKYRRWCERAGDAVGVGYAQRMLEEQRARETARQNMTPTIV